MSSRMKRKVLLMGKSGSGKTSMRSIIFANYLARNTMRLGPTLGVENSNVRFLGNLVLNLWDCGGQDAFMENYFESQRGQIFRNVEVLIYVFDIESSEKQADMEYFMNCLEAIRENSPSAHVFCLIHKMDLIQRSSDREGVFNEQKEELEKAAGDLKLVCFGTSIWDETLYKAWSSIVYTLVPNIDYLQKQLGKLCRVVEADEVVLFEKATFLVISKATLSEHDDVHRYEKISNIIKQFKLSCSKTHAAFHSMEVKNQTFIAFIDRFTENTYIMVVARSDIQTAATKLNLEVAVPHFERIVQSFSG